MEKMLYDLKVIIIWFKWIKILFNFNFKLGFKIIEPVIIEKSWKLLREYSLNERNQVNKNTPVPED